MYHGSKMVYGDDPTYKVVNPHGYILMRSVNHPRAYKKLVREHILVYEKVYNCSLLKWSAIHHKDGDRTNNDWINLEGMIRGSHTSMENRIDMDNRRCAKCGSTVTDRAKYSDRGFRPHWFRIPNTKLFQCGTCYNRKRRNVQKPRCKRP